MRVLHVIATIDPSTGGPAEGLKQLCNVYRLAGHEVDIAALDSPEYVQSRNFPANVIALGPGLGTYSYTRRAVPWLKTNLSRYDVVVINGVWNYNALAAYRALAGTSTPYAIFTHGMLDPYFQHQYPLKHLKKTIYWHAILQKILRNANAVFFTSEEEKILARKSFPNYKVREAVVPYGIFAPTCDMAAATEEFFSRWPHLRGKRLAISLGRIHPKKGTDILIEAFAATLGRYPAWHLVLAGPDQIGWRKDLDALAVKLGCADRITWTGMLEGTTKWGALAASEIFVLPSHSENFGIVVAEALACSLPVIISNKVNIWREISNCRAGLVSDDTVKGTQASLHRWSALTSEEIAALRTRSRTCFDEQFNYRITSRKMLDAIESVAKTNPSYRSSSITVPARENESTLPG